MNKLYSFMNLTELADDEDLVSLRSSANPVSGNFVFYPDGSHVGIVGGIDADGNLLIIHCSGSANGVVITGSAGFTVVARPDYWLE